MGYASLAHTTHFGTLVALPFIDVFLLGVRSQQVLAMLYDSRWIQNTINANRWNRINRSKFETTIQLLRFKRRKCFELMATAWPPLLFMLTVTHGWFYLPFQLLNLEVEGRPTKQQCSVLWLEPCFPIHRGSPSFTSMLNRLSPFFSRGQVTQKQYSERQCTDLSPQCLHLTDLVALDSQDEASKGTRLPCLTVETQLSLQLA